jgi:hypothetical protein
MRRTTISQLAHAAKLAGLAVGAPSARYCFEGRFALPLDGGWALVLSSDDANRVRLDVCLRGRVRATMWCRAGDDRRLVALAGAAAAESASLVA